MRRPTEKKMMWLGQRDSGSPADESWDQGIQKSVIQFSAPLWSSISAKKKYPTSFVGSLFSLVQDKRDITHFHPRLNGTPFRWLMFLLCYSKQLWSSKFSALKSFLLATEALGRPFFHLNHITAKFMYSSLTAPKFHKTEVNWGWKRKWHEAKWQQENNNAESPHCQ